MRGRGLNDIHIAVTGSTGFIGTHLVAHLRTAGYRVRRLVRTPATDCRADDVCIGDLGSPDHLGRALDGVDAVVHAAGIARAGLQPALYERVNVHGTRAIAIAAQRARVRRFVYLSSVRAQSGASSPEPLTEGATPRPVDAYGRSKLAAERVIADTDLDWVALRLTPVYGHGATGNVALLRRLARSGLPLPFASVSGRRSLLSIANLAEAVRIAIAADGRLGAAVVVADEDALTASEMISAMRDGLSRSRNLLPFPPVVLKTLLRLCGSGAAAETLLEPLVVETNRLKSLGWRPVVSARAALADYAKAKNEFPAFEFHPRLR